MASVCPVSCISLHEKDKIRVMNLPMDLLDSLRAVIQYSWSRKIHSEGVYGVSYEFKLHGTPWQGTGEDAIGSRRLISRILAFMLQRGWALIVATNISKKLHDKDAMYFKRQNPEPNVLMAAISFNMNDRIRVIDGTPEVAQIVRSSIEHFWQRGLQGERTYSGEPEFKMHGNPWLPSGTDTMYTRMFLAQLIAALDGLGWEVYTSVDMSYGKGGAKSGGGGAAGGGQAGAGGAGDTGGGQSPLRKLDSWVLKTKAQTNLTPEKIY